MFGRMKIANHSFIMDRARAAGNVVKKTPAAPSGSGKKVHPKPSHSASAPVHKGTTLKIQAGLTAQHRKSPGKGPGKQE